MRQTTTLQWFAGLSEPAQQRLLREAADLQYDEPTAPDAHGVVTIGELGDRPWSRHGFVLWHPETKEVRIAWGSDGLP